MFARPRDKKTKAEATQAQPRFSQTPAYILHSFLTAHQHMPFSALNVLSKNNYM